jgi:hypothetical protein
MSRGDDISIKDLRNRFTNLQTRFKTIFKGNTNTTDTDGHHNINQTPHKENTVVSSLNQDIGNDKVLIESVVENTSTGTPPLQNNTRRRSSHSIRKRSDKSQGSDQLSISPLSNGSEASSSPENNENIKSKRVSFSQQKRLSRSMKPSAFISASREDTHASVDKFVKDMALSRDQLVAKVSKERSFKFLKAKETEAASSNKLKDFEVRLHELLNTGSNASRSTRRDIQPKEPTTPTDRKNQPSLIASYLEKTSEAKLKFASSRSGTGLDTKESNNPYASLISSTATQFVVSPIKRGSKVLKKRVSLSTYQDSSKTKIVEEPRRETISPIPQHASANISPLRPAENPFRQIVKKNDFVV